jgi:hypothetical protein
MKSVYVFLPSVAAVKKFVECLSPLDGQFDLVDGRFIVDARSLMGIFAMDLTVPIELRIEKATAQAMDAIDAFIVKDSCMECEASKPCAAVV